MKRREFRFDKGALIGVPVALVLFFGILFQDRLPQVSMWVLIAGWLAFAAVVVAVLLLLGRGRTKALERVAGELGFSFSAKGDENAVSPLLDAANFEADNAAFHAAMVGELGEPPPEVMKLLAPRLKAALSNRGLERTELRHLSLFGNDVDHRSARNVMSGPVEGGSAVVFDYSYQTRKMSDPGGTFSVTQTVAAFRFPGLVLPAFELSSKGLVQRIASAMGRGDVEFESHPGFSRRFRLRADDESAVRLLFPPAVLDFFEHLDPAFDQTVEGARECVVVYRGGQEVDAAAVRAFINQATAVASLFRARAPEGGA